MIEQVMKQRDVPALHWGDGPMQACEIDVKHCVFRCVPSWFSLPATAVRELRLAPDLVAVPGSHAALAGLCHVHSEFLPVLRLNVLLDDQPAVNSQDEKLLVISGSGRNWALLITDVVALESLETLVDPNAPVTNQQLAAVRGTATYRDQIVRVVDPGALYRHIQETLNSCWNDLVPSFSHSDETTRGQR